jgi:hypothetical protein
VYASGIAVAMHLLIFLLVRPAADNGLAGSLVPPRTHYLATAGSADPGMAVRSIWSPVMFSLPSQMGFSRSLDQESARTRLSFSRPIKSEKFLRVDGPENPAKTVELKDLMLTSTVHREPGVPEGSAIRRGETVATPRVQIEPELKERLVGGVVLPPALNRPESGIWQVRADIRIAADGAIRHVLLEKPMEDAVLNQQMLQLLYSLQFKAGDRPVDGRIEVYSPEPMFGADTP